MSKVRRCRFGQSRKYLRPINFACYQIMNRCYWGFHLILLVVDLGSHLLDHVIDQIIEFHTHNLSESHTLLSLQALRLCISSSLVLLLTSNEGEPKLAWQFDMPPPPVTRPVYTCEPPDTDWRPWPGHSWVSGAEAGLAPAPAWELPSASSASQLCQYLSWSTVNKYKPQLSLGATHSFSSVVSIAVILSSVVMMDDGGFIGSDLEKERGGGPCYQFYCYDILRLPPSQTVVTIEAGGSLCAALCWGSWPWHLTMLRLVTDADLAPGGLVSNTLIGVAG